MPADGKRVSDFESGGLWPDGDTAEAWTVPSAPATPLPPAADDRHGHRERLRQRLFDAGPTALADYELLESALFLAFPRHDTKPLAKALIREFGSLAGVLGATPGELKARMKGKTGVKGLNAKEGLSDTVIGAIKTIHAISVRALQREAMRGPVLASIDTVLAYLHLDKAGLIVEQFRVLFLNNRNRLVRDEVLWEGTVNQAPAYPREIAKRALELGATAIILVHNHPSGDPSESQDDVRMTRAIEEAARPLGIAVHDHLIIAKSGHVSFRANGLI